MACAKYSLITRQRVSEATFKDLVICLVQDEGIKKLTLVT